MLILCVNKYGGSGAERLRGADMRVGVLAPTLAFDLDFKPEVIMMDPEG